MRLIFKHQYKIIFLVTVYLYLTSSLALAQEETKVYLESSDTSADTFTVDVIAQNVTDLYGAEVKLLYDPSVLAVQDADPDREGLQITTGEFLPANQGFVVANEADNEAGTVTYALTLLNPATPMNGTGIIATISFEKLQDSPVVIEFEKAKLVASTLQAIPNQTTPLEIGSQEQPEINQPIVDTKQAPVVIKTKQSNSSEKTLTPWLVAGGAITLAIVGLGLLVLLGSVALFGQRPHIATQKSSTLNKSTPQILLQSASNVRIQRPQLQPYRRR